MNVDPGDFWGVLKLFHLLPVKNQRSSNTENHCILLTLSLLALVNWKIWGPVFWNDFVPNDFAPNDFGTVTALGKLSYGFVLLAPWNSIQTDKSGMGDIYRELHWNPGFFFFFRLMTRHPLLKASTPRHWQILKSVCTEHELGKHESKRNPEIKNDTGHVSDSQLFAQYLSKGGQSRWPMLAAMRLGLGSRTIPSVLPFCLLPCRVQGLPKEQNASCCSCCSPREPGGCHKGIAGQQGMSVGYQEKVIPS